MALSVALILGLLSVAVFAVVSGHFSKRIELYFLGVVVLFFVGLSLVTQGYSVVSGYELDRNETDVVMPDNSTDKFVYEVQSVVRENVFNEFTTAFGLLFVIIASGLSLTFFRDRKRQKEKKVRSLDVVDDF